MSKKKSKNARLHIAVFFTWDVSLKIWQDKGLLAREFRLYEELNAHGVDFTFITWGGADDLEIAKAYPQFKFIPLYTLIPCPSFKLLRALCSLIVPFRLRSRLQGVDILKTNQMWGAWVAVFTKWLTRKPLILRSGFELYDFTLKSGASKLRCGFIKLISKFSYKNADKIFVATAHDKSIAAQVFKVDEARITLRPNWIDTDIFKPLDVQDTKGRLLFVGRLSAQKNLKMLIDACAAEGIGLDIYGNGEMRAELESYAKSQNADVAFMGAVANDALPDIYNTYRAYVLCSHYEGNPKTLLEAMACGALCVGTKVDGIDNVLTHEKTGLLCDNSLDALRKFITHAMSSNKDFSAIKNAAAAEINENYSLKSAVTSELKTYKEIMND